MFQFWKKSRIGSIAAPPASLEQRPSQIRQFSQSRIGSISERLASIEQKLSQLEQFSHGARAVYVGRDRVLIKCVVGGAQIAYFVEANDLLLAPWFIVSGAYETDLTNFFLSSLRPDSHCIDVGANFGYFTCLMARFCPQGRVIGLEPDAPVMEIARDNVFINGLHGIAEVLRAAASDKAGEITLHRRVTRSGNTSVIKPSSEFLNFLSEPDSQAFTVPTLPVDSFLERLNGRVDFMKIDVEGAEPLVFRGAQRTIADNPNLRIVMEWSPGQIQGAGFDVGAFLDELKALDLSAHSMTSAATEALSYPQLAQMPYAAGVLLKRSQ